MTIDAPRQSTARLAFDGELAAVARRGGNLVLFVTRPRPATAAEWYELYVRERVDNVRRASSDVYELRCERNDCSGATWTLFASGTSSRTFFLSSRSRIWLVEYHPDDSLRIRSCETVCSPPAMVPDAGRLSSAAPASEQSLLVAAVRETSDETGYDIAMTVCDDVSCRPQTYLELDVLTDAVPLATSTEGLPRLAYRNSVSKEAYLIECSDMSCSRSVRRPLGDRIPFSVTVGSDGRTLVLSADTNDELILTHCLTDDCARMSHKRLRVPGARRRHVESFGATKQPMQANALWQTR